jgi:uncharacterized protein YceK
MKNAVKISVLCVILQLSGCATIISIIDDWAGYESEVVDVEVDSKNQARD